MLEHRKTDAKKKNKKERQDEMQRTPWGFA